MGLGLAARYEASTAWPAQLHSPRTQRDHHAPATRGGVAADGSSLPAPRCGLAEEDEESPRSTSEVATRTGTHRRCMSMMRWFGGGETTAFGHRRWRPGAQRWLAASYKTGGRMGMRRRGVVNSRRGAREGGAHRGRQWRRCPLQNPVQMGQLSGD
jgi:hypothetical protein